MKLLTGQGLLMLFRVLIMSFIMGRGRQFARQFTCAHLALFSPGQKRTSAARTNTVRTLTRILLRDTYCQLVFWNTTGDIYTFYTAQHCAALKIPTRVTWEIDTAPFESGAQCFHPLWWGARGQIPLLTVCCARLLDAPDLGYSSARGFHS